jgi:hypothetical protein
MGHPAEAHTSTYVEIGCGTLLPMLFLFQAPAAHLADGTPIYVTVQQPTGGFPEWAKIVISAAVGALLGIISSIVMEYVKPVLFAKRVKHEVRDMVMPELKRNMKSLEDFLRRVFPSEASIGQARKDDIPLKALVSMFLGKLSSDRYSFCFEKEKAALYALDGRMCLTAFYENVKTARYYCETGNYVMLVVAVRLALQEGEAFLGGQGRVYGPSDGHESLENNGPDKEMSA